MRITKHAVLVTGAATLVLAGGSAVLAPAHARAVLTSELLAAATGTSHPPYHPRA